MHFNSPEVHLTLLLTNTPLSFHPIPQKTPNINNQEVGQIFSVYMQQTNNKNTTTFITSVLQLVYSQPVSLLSGLGRVFLFNSNEKQYIQGNNKAV